MSGDDFGSLPLAALRFCGAHQSHRLRPGVLETVAWPEWQLVLLHQHRGCRGNIQGSGNETRAFIYIDDFVDGLIKIMHEGEYNNIYNIGTEEEVSINTVVNLIAKALDIKINLIPSSLKQGSTNRRCPDITKIKNIGFMPMTSLQDGLAKTISWYIK